MHYAQQRHAVADDPLAGEPTDRFAEAGKLWNIALELFTSAANHEQQKIKNSRQLTT